MITDGTGTGVKAKVNSENKLLVESVTETAFENQAEEGNAFNLNTEDIVLDGGISGEQGLLYIKNNESSDLEIVGWFIGIRDADRTGATSDTNLFKLIANPTGGTLISDASEAAVANRNLGSPRVFDVTAYKASGDGKTVTGGEATLLYQYHTAGRIFGTVTFTIPRGSSLAILVNTYGANMTLYTGFTGYLA
jgi:hypothetical protein